MERAIFIIILAPFLCVANARCRIAIDPPDTLSSAKQIVYAVALDLANRACSEFGVSGGERLALFVEAPAHREIIEHALASSLRSHGVVLSLASDSTRSDGGELRVEVLECRSQLDSFRNSTPDNRDLSFRRTTSLSLSFLATDSTRHVVFSKVLQDSRIDTVARDDVEAEKAELPNRESMLDRLFEPLIVVGAAAVVIFLLFHVRS